MLFILWPATLVSQIPKAVTLVRLHTVELKAIKCTLLFRWYPYTNQLSEDAPCLPEELCIVLAVP